MSEKKKPTPTSGGDPSPERIVEGRSGLDRLAEAMKRILKEPKPEVRQRDSPTAS